MSDTAKDDKDKPNEKDTKAEGLVIGNFKLGMSKFCLTP